MRYTECANGHVYDADQYAVCPYCNQAQTEIQFGPGGGRTVAPGGAGGTVAPGGFGPAPGGATVAPGGFGGSPLDGERIMPVGGGEDAQKTVAPDMFRRQAEQSNKTVAVFRQQHGIDRWWGGWCASTDRKRQRLPAESEDQHHWPGRGQRCLH